MRHVRDKYGIDAQAPGAHKQQMLLDAHCPFDRLCDPWTYPTGVVQIYHFPNQQVERHFTDGLKEITFPNGTLKVS